MDKGLTPIQLLDSNNYSVWKMKMMMFLEYHDVWGVVEGTWVRPAQASENFAPWQKAMTKAKNLIGMAVADSQVEHIRGMNDPKEMWDRLAAIYEPKSRQYRLIVRKKLFTLQMDENDSVQEHLNQIKTIQHTLEAMGGVVQAEDMLTIIITSLPPSYEPLVMTLEALGDTLTEEQIITHLLQEEVRRNQSTSKKDGEAFMLQRQNAGAHKYSNKKSGRKDKSKDTCHKCSKKGHWAKECLSGDGRGKGSKMNQANDVEVLDVFFASTEKDKKSIWYIDSGASEHIT